MFMRVTSITYRNNETSNPLNLQVPILFLYDLANLLPEDFGCCFSLSHYSISIVIIIICSRLYLCSVLRLVFA